MGKIRFRAARVADLETLLRLQARYYDEDGYPHRERRAREAWRRLLSRRGLGRTWVAVSAGRPLGYVVVTFGYSLEYLGADAFVDELYLLPAARGRGLGRMALRLAERACREVRVKALHLEVERSKARARGLYRSAGFEDRGRLLMTKRLGRRDPKRS